MKAVYNETTGRSAMNNAINLHEPPSKMAAGASRRADAGEKQRGGRQRVREEAGNGPHLYE